MDPTETQPHSLTVEENVLTLTLTYGSGLTAAEKAAIEALGTASTREADQDLRTTDDVEFNSVSLHTAAFDTTNGGPTALGEMAWDSVDGTLDIMADGGVKIAVGEDGMIRVRNVSGTTIAKGAPLVYVGTNGASTRINVRPWIGESISDVRQFLGFAAGAMAQNADGYSTWFGKIKEIDTDGGAELWDDGDIIYAIPGASATLSNIRPTSGDYVTAAVVINAGSGTSGSIFVRPTFDTVAAASVINFNDLGDATTADLPTINTPLGTALGLKADASSLATVATSGAYSDLSGTPTLGTAASVDSDQNLRTDDDVRFSSIRTSGATIYGLDDGSGNTAYAQFAHTATGDLTISTESTGTGTAGDVIVNSDVFAFKEDSYIRPGEHRSNMGLHIRRYSFGFFYGSSPSGKYLLNVDVNQIIINPNSGLIDFLVKGNDSSNLLFADVSESKVGIGTNTPARKLHVTDAMRLDPTTTPASPSAGDIYFDSTTNKLRCYDGTVWNDLF